MKKFKQRVARSGGQALPEYIVRVLVIVAALFTRLPILDNKTSVEFVADAFQKNYRGYEYVMSQPAYE